VALGLGPERAGESPAPRVRALTDLAALQVLQNAQQYAPGSPEGTQRGVWNRGLSAKKSEMRKIVFIIKQLGEAVCV